MCASNKLRGVNLGNWLVLEKWMGNSPLATAQAMDDRDLIDELPQTQRFADLANHYHSFVSEADFAWLAHSGVRLLRIPIPYHLFGTKHHPPCVTPLDNAFRWAEKYGLHILIDLHTVPFSQNASDNGGFSGLCSWHRKPDSVAFVLSVLEAVAKRYADSAALWGIEPLNEPARAIILAANLLRYGKGHLNRMLSSRPIPHRFLKQFYTSCYERLRSLTNPGVRLVLHDQFDLSYWRNWAPADDDSVWIDTHQYLAFVDRSFKRFDLNEYLDKTERLSEAVADTARIRPVLVGEWCLANHAQELHHLNEDELRCWYRTFADAQLDAWDRGNGSCFWSYKVEGVDHDNWSLRYCVERGWIDCRHGIARQKA